MGISVFVLGGLLIGAALQGVLRRHTKPYHDDAARLLDRIAATALLTFAVWVATSWALALVGWLSPTPLIVAGTVELVVGGAWLYLGRTGLVHYRSPRAWVLVGSLVALTPVIFWTALVTSRGVVLPPYNADALAYHFPKAMLLMKAARFQFIDLPEPRISTWPCDYELLLADIMTLTHSDHLTAAISTLSYLVLAVMTARICAVWWGSGIHLAFAAAVVCAVPIVIVHSGLHKNDLLCCVFAVAAFMWGARWYAAACRGSAILATLALILVGGTKLNGAFVVIGGAPLLIAGAIRWRARLRAKTVLAYLGVAIASSFLLGVVAYLANLVAIHRLVLSPSFNRPPGPAYGDWSNIWEYTVLALMVPFSRRTQFVWNPFVHAYWRWPSNDIWASHFGALASILILLLVPCIMLAWHRGRARGERNASSLAALVSYVTTLPLHTTPHGFYQLTTRYLVFILPFVAAWTIPTLLKLLTMLFRGREALAGALVSVVIAGAGANAVWVYGVHDIYAPLAWMFYSPYEQRHLIRDVRAVHAFDALAGPDAVCAIDLDFDSWIYPAYGEGWTRTVKFLKPQVGDVPIPDDVDWVLIDHKWNIVVADPRFVDMGHAQFFDKGKPTAADVKLHEQMTRDPRFELRYFDTARNQYVYARKPGAAGR